MSQYTTKYKTENGKTRKVKEAAAKPDDKNGTPASSGAENKPNQPGTPAKQGGNQ